ncbi:Isy1-like splicing factor [Fimicolochytrium jonesii]|uniref:Isy1-like splicing factor n=1 Tax=Fimicolochytrium jonesii TaxID=1396493 RepID=UPI0022FF20B9|nr:Isy1-like splicing factor [Fimicolochytrium jonesii]KAI8826687.1 Isy1-like splicing factor [Fimicolochytrium jonesii]
MARNEEKAQSMLYRFREAQAAELGFKKTEKRPYLASEVSNLKEAEKWRHQIIREISQKVSKIQDSGLTDYQVRDLNDEINKLLREKRHWENRIRELGGPDYRKVGPRLLDNEGKEVPGARGYKYFGRAKDLPGVRELFAEEVPTVVKSTRSDLNKRVDADYYGYRDEEDGLLLQYEAEVERKLRDGNEPSPSKSVDDPLLHVPVPSQKEVEAWLVQRRQKELAERFLMDGDTTKA